MTTILVIEDHQGMRENICELLELENYNVLSEADGSAGIAAVKLEKPHFILCDMNLPDLTGHEVLHKLKKDSDISHIPVILMSAFVHESEVKVGIAMGAKGYLSKPFDISDLKKIID